MGIKKALPVWIISFKDFFKFSLFLAIRKKLEGIFLRMVLQCYF